MTEQLAAENVETAPQVDLPEEEQANSNDETTETLETVTDESEGDTFIAEDKLTPAMQKRINKLTWEKHEAERKAAARIQELEQQIQAKHQEQPSIAPTLAQFDYDDEKYQDAMIDYRVAQKLKEQAPQPSAPAVDQVSASFLQRRQKYAEENTEYLQMATDPSMANAITPSTGMYNYIIAAENGPKLHHHLLNNASEVVRIQALPDWAQGAELAKIESKLSMAKQKAKSNAPTPVKPVANSTASSTGSNSPSPFPKSW